MAKSKVAGILLSRWYPLNVANWCVYVGKYHGDQRYGFPTNRHVFEEWKGTDVTGVKGSEVLRKLNRGLVKLIARSMYRR